MKKYIFIIIITLVCSSHLCTQIQTGANISTEDYSIVTENGFSRINFGYRFYTDSIGYPEIPVIHKSYAIPIDATNVSLQINTCTTSTLMENCTIYPVQPPQINGSNDDVEFAGPNPNLYGQTALYPNIEAQIISDNKVMGFRIVEIALYPFAYLPNSKILYKRDISCSLNYSSTTNQLFHAPKISEQRALSVRAYVAGLVENSEDVKNTPVTFPRNARTADPNFSVQKNVIPDYIIITNEELKGEFQRLADWKTKKGVPTIIKTVEEIKEEYTGADLVDKIRNFIVDFGNKWGEEGLYLLLGGDINIIPSRKIKSENPTEGQLFPTDACYVDPNFAIKNWETMELESSKTRNICMGRLPVSTIQEANKYIDKLIHYEKSDLDIDYSYIRNLLIASGFIGDNYTLGKMNDFDRYRKSHYPENWNYWYLFDHFNCNCIGTSHTNYDKTFGAELNRNNFISALNGNLSHGYSHIVLHDDHGHTFQIGTSSTVKGEGIYATHLSGLENSDYQNILFSGSCNSANFSQNCIGWDFLRKGNTIAYIGNSDVGWSTEEAQFQVFLNNLYTKKLDSRIGYVHLKLVHATHHTCHRRHLLGDPEMPIWTDIPQTLNVSVSPEYTVAHHEETTEVSVQVNNLPVGKSATVCIMKDTEIYTIARISDTEVHTFYFQPLTGGNITVTVTAKNFKPFEATIPVQVVEPTLTIDSIAFLSGNNGVISPGEDVRMNISIKNDGLFTSNHVTAQLYTESPYINLTKDFISYGSIDSGDDLTTAENFRFTVSGDAPDISRKDFNAVVFYLAMSKENGFYDIDTFRVDLMTPKYKIVSHTKSPNSSVSAGNTYTITTEFIKTGKIPTSNLHVEVEALSPGISNISYQNANRWNITIANDHQVGNSLNLKTKLYSGTLLLDSSIVDLTSVAIAANDTIVRFKSNENSITLYWDNVYNAYGYHIYRSETVNGTYVRLNKLPLTGNYFIDEELDTTKDYYYRISAVNNSLIEGEQSAPIKAWTVYPTSGLFPISLTGYENNYIGEATTMDFNYDGQKEIILSARRTTIDNVGEKGTIVIANPDGTEPFDIDYNVTTFSGYAEIPWRIEATPTVADIYGTGEPCVIVPTRHLIPQTDNHVICYSSIDKDGDNLPDLLWNTQVNSLFYRSATVTDINASDGKGEKEIIVRSTEGITGMTGTAGIRIFDCNGNLLDFLGKDTLNNHYGTIAVADLDNDDNKEIITTNSNKIYVWNHDGNLKDGKVFFQDSYNRLLTSSPIVGDFDNDNEKEVIVASQTNPSYIYVVNQDGTCLSGFDGTTNSASIPYNRGTETVPGVGICHSVSVGDIDGDGLLELVTIGSDCVKAWNSDGTLCFNREITGLFPMEAYKGNITTPILADINGDSSIDIVFHEDNKIYALDNQGNDIIGFPLRTVDPIHNGLCVSDTDNDGLNEIIVGDNVGFIYVWETQGKSSAIEWGRAQFDTENTSEYVSGYKDQWVITNNTTWNGGTYSNDIIVRSGTFTIPEGVTLNMRKPYRIYVMDGAILNVEGGTITNADIVIKDGGTLNLTQNSTINLRSTGGNLQVDKGGAMNMPQGAIY